MRFKVASDEEKAAIVAHLKTYHGVEVLPDRIAIDAKPREQIRQCSCGCGEPCSEGVFLRGHPAKLRKALFAIIRGKDQVPPELQIYGPEYRPLEQWTPSLASEALSRRGWQLPVGWQYDVARAVEEAEKAVETVEPVSVVRPVEEAEAPVEPSSAPTVDAALLADAYEGL